MTFLTEAIIDEANKRHPEASNNLEALDLYAQDVYKEIQSNNSNLNFYEENEYNIHLYHVIRLTREDENNKMIEQVSSFKINQN
jgi:hypothetical protein